METIMKLSHLTKTFANGRGIFDVNFSVGAGEVFGYLGPNGAGKTTTIRHLMGFLKPAAGACEMFGQDCFTNAAQIAERLGYLAGEPVFFPDMTGEAYLTFMADMRRMKSRKRMEELMDLFELGARPGPMRKMSKGMRQKLGLICAFMDEPEAVILDEPTSGLDPLMQSRFVELILEEKKKGTTILMSSHMFEEVEKTCDRAAIIRDGRIADTLDMHTLAAKRSKRYTATFPDAAAAERFAGRTREDQTGEERFAGRTGADQTEAERFAGRSGATQAGEERFAAQAGEERFAGESGVTVISCRDHQVEFAVTGSPAKLLGQLSEAGITDLSVRSQSLEELFLEYYHS